MRKTKFELKIGYFSIAVFFSIFLLLPLGALLCKSFLTDAGFSFDQYVQVITERDFLVSFNNSIGVSLATAVTSTTTAFLLVITLTETRLNTHFKKFIKTAVMLPMLLPTLTYGFSIMYAYGRQGLVTRLLGADLFQIYGFWGMLLGYVIYTLPCAFLLIHNAAGYVDKKFVIVSRLMGDSSSRTVMNTLIRPLMGAIGGAFVLSFVLSFTDYGIPAALGGTYSVLATKLYDVMLGAIPDINKGAVVAMLLLLPAAFGFMLLNYLEKFNFHYDRITTIEVSKNRLRDGLLGGFSVMILFILGATLSVLLVVPFVKDYPYNNQFTLEIIKAALKTDNLLKAYQNTLFVAALTSVLGTLIAYVAALINTRSTMTLFLKRSVDVFSMLCNTVPGMVIGVSYLLVFNRSSLKGTLCILVICNTVHFFTTPYLMAKNGLSKMNPRWETAAALLGDSWLKTVWRVILPNSKTTLIEMLSYYFVNSMVTVSAVIFLVSTRAIVVTSKIKELQYFEKYSEVFVLSLLILMTNLGIKAVAHLNQNPRSVSRRLRHTWGLIIKVFSKMYLGTQKKQLLTKKESEVC